MTRFLLALLVLLGAVPAAHAITSGRAPAATDRRFDAVAGFTRTEWRDINNVFGNAVLISRDRVVIARHLINDRFRTPTSTDGAPADYTVRFRRRPDGGVGDVADPTSFHHVRIKQWVFLPGRSDRDDVAIGVLETPVTHIAPIALDFKSKPGSQSSVLLASWGPEAPPTGVVPKGRLLIGDAKLRTSGTYLSLAARSKKAPSEVVLNDSGAPVLLVSGSSVRMIGLVATTSGGPALRPLDGSRLFPKLPKR